MAGDAAAVGKEVGAVCDQVAALDVLQASEAEQVKGVSEVAGVGSYGMRRVKGSEVGIQYVRKGRQRIDPRDGSGR